MKNFVQKYPAKYTLPVFGLVAGVLSSLSLWGYFPKFFGFSDFSKIDYIEKLGIPGMVFGVVIGVFFYVYFKEQKKLWWKIFVWIAISWAGFFITLWGVSSVESGFLEKFFGSLTPGGMEGVVLTVLLSASVGLLFSIIPIIALTQVINWFFIRLSIGKHIVIAVTGFFISIISLWLNFFVKFWWLDLFASLLDLNYLLLFVIWQTGMAFLFGWAIDSANKKQGSQLI